MKEDRTEELELLASIKSGAPASLKYFYESYRKEFVKWAHKNFNCSYEEAIDIYQDAIIVLFENIVNEKFTQVESKLKPICLQLARILFCESLINKKGRTQI